MSGITVESNSDALDKLSLNIDCTLELIVPNSTSPILAVPAIVRNPSGPKNIKSPANSCIVSPFIQPMLRVTDVTAKLELDVPVNLNIRVSQNINKSSRKTLRPTTVSSTLKLPAPYPLTKASSSKGSLNITSCFVVALPA